ncbi:MAG: hypothetical protein IKN78_11610 [Bacteroidales bacterium]|nr:hypothetical protein [Bacteroidales bacterium]
MPAGAPATRSRSSASASSTYMPCTSTLMLLSVFAIVVFAGKSTLFSSMAGDGFIVEMQNGRQQHYADRLRVYARLATVQNWDKKESLDMGDERNRLL